MKKVLLAIVAMLLLFTVGCTGQTTAEGNNQDVLLLAELSQQPEGLILKSDDGELSIMEDKIRSFIEELKTIKKAIKPVGHGVADVTLVFSDQGKEVIINYDQAENIIFFDGADGEKHYYEAGNLYQLIKTNYPNHTGVSVGLEAEPSEKLGQWIEEHKVKPGIWTYELINTRVIMIAMGEQPTGGYGVLVSEPSLKDGAIDITVEFKKPRPDAFTIQVITYPYEIIFVHNERLVNINFVDGDRSDVFTIAAPNMSKFSPQDFTRIEITNGEGKVLQITDQEQLAQLVSNMKFPLSLEGDRIKTPFSNQLKFYYHNRAVFALRAADPSLFNDDRDAQVLVGNEPYYLDAGFYKALKALADKNNFNLETL